MLSILVIDKIEVYPEGFTVFYRYLEVNGIFVVPADPYCFNRISVGGRI